MRWWFFYIWDWKLHCRILGFGVVIWVATMAVFMLYAYYVVCIVYPHILVSFWFPPQQVYFWIGSGICCSSMGSPDLDRVRKDMFMICVWINLGRLTLLWLWCVFILVPGLLTDCTSVSRRQGLIWACRSHCRELWFGDAFCVCGIRSPHHFPFLALSKTSSFAPQDLFKPAGLIALSIAQTGWNGKYQQ